MQILPFSTCTGPGLTGTNWLNNAVLTIQGGPLRLRGCKYKKKLLAVGRWLLVLLAWAVGQLGGILF
jgi:hypothetical protein